VHRFSADVRAISAHALAQAGAVLVTVALLATGWPMAAQAAPPDEPTAKPTRAASTPAAARAARFRAAMGIHRRQVGSLMSRSGVVGTGVGLDAAGEPEVRVFTERPLTGLPAHVEGVPVRARVTGRVYALRGPTCDVDGDGVCQVDERWPLPVPIGVSIGHPAITAGTIGARVTDGVQHFALSNNHVLASSNAASIGDAALQPGVFDGGSVAAGDAIGTLFDFEPITFCTIVVIFPVCSVANFFDGAIALVTPAELGFETPGGEFGSAPGYGAPNFSIHPAYGVPGVFGDESLPQLVGVPVQKHGRTTGLTAGVIDSVQVSIEVCYDALCTQVALFEDQLHVTGAFSEGGDSGSLVVTDDGFRHPVGLLFAGSPGETFLSRIDFVLDRFGVSIDDGGTTAPITDAAVSGIAPPSFALVGQPTTVPVTVRNVGTEPLAAFDVLFEDTTEITNATLTAPALGPGAQAQLDFVWTPTATGPHDLRATLQLVDDEPSNDQVVAAGVSVLLKPPPLSLRLWKGTVRTDAWTQVTLNVDYGSDMVVVCTPLYDVTGFGPAVTRVRNASGTSFEVGLGRPWFGAFPGEEFGAEVQCMIVRAGVYDPPGNAKLEAVRLDGFTPKDGGGSWVGQAQTFGQAYTQPVVVGQVISQTAGLPGDIGVWTTFWARGPTSFDPPSAGSLYVGRHTGEDPGARGAETVAYVVMEAGTGTLSNKRFVAGLGAETVRGVDDGPPFAYTLPSFLSPASHAVASSAGMDGLEGGWPILYGPGAVSASELHLAIEEDWYYDTERSHTTEQVAYLVFGPQASVCGLGPELALVLPVLAALARRRSRRRH